MSICKDIQQKIEAQLENILSLRADRDLKDDKSFVTKGDLLCQDIIVEHIQSLETPFEIISEEIDLGTFAYDKEKNYVIVDPIDGTENFTSGLREWGISIAIYEKGTHVESMLGLPELNVWLHTGDTIQKYESRILGLSSSLSKDDMNNIPRGPEYRIIGCCVYNVYNAITGSFASFENVKGANTWDILAGCNLALEHGRKVTVDGKPYAGEFLSPNKKYLFKIG